MGQFWTPDNSLQKMCLSVIIAWQDKRLKYYIIHIFYDLICLINDLSFVTWNKHNMIANQTAVPVLLSLTVSLTISLLRLISTKLLNHSHFLLVTWYVYLDTLNLLSYNRLHDISLPTSLSVSLSPKWQAFDILIYSL